MKYIMGNFFMNFLIFTGIALFIYLFFFRKSMKEGLENQTSHGIAGDAESYGAKIKKMVIDQQDRLFISKYRTDYENIVLDLDDYINSSMLEKILQLDLTNPMDTFQEIVTLNDTKLALNNIMKYIDKN